MSTLDEDGRAKVRADKVGFVFQSFQLLPSLTALENVMLPLELRGDADAEGTARATLGKVGLAERLAHYLRQLSGECGRAPYRARGCQSVSLSVVAVALKNTTQLIAYTS